MEKEQKYRVSVLMGIYNCASTLDEALESLYNQTFQDFKIILCDDGSSDNTYKIAKTHALEHDNIVLIKNEKNMGLNYTLNHCLEYADTEYCARMDGDDISLPTRFEEEIRFLDEHPEFAIVTTPMKYFDDKGIFRIGTGGTEPKLTDFPKSTPFCHAPCMIKTQAYKAVGGYSVDPKLLRVEDYNLWIKMYQAGYKGYTLENPLYMMRDDRNAANRRNFKSRCNEAYVKHLACTMLNLPFYYHIYCLRPLILGIMPKCMYRILRKFR